MTNVIQLSKSQGFTRMDNEIYEALIGADLSGRELRVALAIHRLTAGYNVATSRIAAATIAKLANLRREHVSRMVSELIRQRVIFRAGGSKGPLGLSPVSEWRIDPKNEEKKSNPNSAQCAISGTSLVPFPAHIKDSKDINTTDVVLRAPREIAQVKPAKAPKAKTGLTAKDLLDDNPHGLSAETIADYIALRVKKRATMTARVWRDLNAKLTELAGKGVQPEEAMGIALVQGWQGFEVQWVLNRVKPDQRPASRQAGPDFNSDDTGWANDLGFM